MSLSNRIFSLETEYALNFYPSAGKVQYSPEQVAGQIIQAIKHQYGGTEFLRNGSRLYFDVGHVEWSLPECLGAYEAAVYDKAADTVLHHAQESTEESLDAGQILIAKNNVDSVGNSYGCHENYLMLLNSEWLKGQDFLQYLIRLLTPFLVSRQVLCGSGMFSLSDLGNAPTYHISQRAAHINLLWGSDTRSSRPIVHLGRENESLAGGSYYRRLHLILGDANLSGWATWMKLGTTGLILRMIEDLYVASAPPILADPVRAMKDISSDWTCKRTVPLYDGRSYTAVDIQWEYYNLVADYLERFGSSKEEDQTFNQWGTALEDLDQDVMRLQDRADWVIKKLILDQYLAQRRLSWEQRSWTEENASDLRAYNLLYHDLSSNGHYARIFPDDTLTQIWERQQAVEIPPLHTRARVRGMVADVHHITQGQIGVTPTSWGSVDTGGTKVDLPDPFDFDASSVKKHILDYISQLEKTNSNKNLWGSIAHGFMYFMDYARAIKSFERGRTTHSSDVDFLSGMGHALAAGGEPQNAIQCFEEAARISFEKTDFAELGNLYLSVGQYKQARTAFEKCMSQHHSQLCYGLRGLGDLALFQRRPVDALYCYKEFLQWAPVDIHGLAAAGLAAACLGQEEVSGSYFTAATKVPLLHSQMLIKGGSQYGAHYYKALAMIGLGTPGWQTALTQALVFSGKDTQRAQLYFEHFFALWEKYDYPPAQLEAAKTFWHSSLQAIQSSASETSNAFFPETLEALLSPHASVRIRALKSIGTQPPVPLILQLKDMAISDSDSRVRHTAVLALGVAGTALAKNTLIDFLKLDDRAMRWSAEEALEHFNVPWPREIIGPMPEEPLVVLL